MDMASSHFTRRAFLGGAVVFGAASLMTPKPAFADRKSKDVQAEADAARIKLDNMLTQLEEASNNYHAALEDFEEASDKRDAAETRIKENDVRIGELQGSLSSRVRTMYRTGATPALDMLLGATSFEAFVQNWDFLTMMNQQDADLVAETKTLREDNEAQRDEYAKQADIAKTKLAEAESIQAEAEVLVGEYQAQVDALDAEVAELVEKERREAAAQRAAEEAARLEAERAEAQSQAQAEVEQQTQQNSNNGGGGGSNNNNNSSKPAPQPQNDIPPSGSVVDYAISQLGVPYVWGGTQPGVGLDCSGLTSWCWQQATGKWIGRTTWDQYANAKWIGSVGEAMPGDVLYNGGHVGICTEPGGGTYIHAPQPGEVVTYSSWPQFYCALRF